ncbi:exodeoxyribonuclease V subunit beta [Thiocapsa bogorovii]|uniref:exodeoxyribonuclease V subunit beta n=1 Tax=Thiocapsa bogorovii TaxID=521689 RepID=UPI001E3E1054|nr:exodeoxyribonuclease V subunit beta [Thiocapsa bogorovii]UHD17478.1 exodeoxyribonuclease V subunit beta [Thiocapsa bogorovii]
MSPANGRTTATEISDQADIAAVSRRAEARPTGSDSLDPLRFPLCGSRLIEASAGTGKTFTIATLYVRLVLGHVAPYDIPDAAPQAAQDIAPRAFTPPEILVVTFTDAATRELRDRIRVRLAEAANAFRAESDGIAARPPGEDPLHDLRAEYPPEHWPACARKLQLASEWMDEAAVSTIHGWCNRMLREHAFDSDSHFTQTLESDQSELLAEVVRDYWRTFMVPLDAESVAEVRRWWSGPEALQGAIRPLVEHADRLDPAAEPAIALKAVRKEKADRLAELKAPWVSWADELEALLNEAVTDKCVDGRKLRAHYYQPWLTALRGWAADHVAESLDLGKGWERLTPAGLADALKSGDPPGHPALEAIACLPADLADLPTPRSALLRHAARWVADRFSAEQTRRAQMGFSDLLTRLDAALQGPNGERLAEIIRRQFPVALIDEFQDTDPVQYRIFDAVYRVAANDPTTALILIGDPKQAIYAFRGADIYTYLAARRDFAGRLYTLKRNYRSTPEMVAATNRSFEVAETRASGAGAFLFRTETETDTGTGTDNPVPFITADAQGRKDALQVDGQPVPALTACWLPPNEAGKALSKDAYRTRIAEVCASEMVRLLNLGQTGQAAFVGDGAPKALRPADLAVLVNTCAEAAIIRRALAQRGVRSVYLSDRDSVYQSPQAGELQHWLAACAEPDDARLLRAALATATLGLSWPELDRLNHDELAWESRVLQFRAYRDAWRRQGVLPMLRRLLNDFDLPARLLASESMPGPGSGFEGERILTDLLHLAELLQQASVLLDGEHALIRHLAEQCRDADRGANGDARQIRLESDADLVQVVTVHKSKGLEYPLVFLPFAADYRQTKRDDLPLKWHDAQGRLQLGLCADDEILKRADRERLGEDLRKLYVALTRARHATWVGLAPLADLERGAFGYLLGGDAALAPDGLAQALEDLRGDCASIAVIEAPEPSPDASPDASREHFVPAGPARRLGPARTSVPVVDEPWWIASYSALRTVAGDDTAYVATSARAAGQIPAATPTEDRFREMQVEQAAAPGTELSPSMSGTDASDRAPAAGSIHAFPRGPEAGTFLHDLLEWAANPGFAETAADPVRLRDTIARRCQVRGWSQWIDPLTTWLGSSLATRLPVPAMGALPATAFRLVDLTGAVPEMEFWLAAHRADTREIDRLVCAYTLDREPRPALQPAHVNGMFKGFMDLVFEHEGRYYVADYKSNWLGPDAAAYTPEAMRAEILHARYELQYVLYLFALHRLLKARLPDYDYDRHVGGAVYLFLRGIESSSRGLHAERPPRELIEALDRCFARRVEEGACA